MKIKNQSQRLPFLDFSNPLKQIKIKSFVLKNSFENLYINTRKNENFCSWKSCSNTNSNGGIYSPISNLPVGNRQGHFCPSGRPA